MKTLSFAFIFSIFICRCLFKEITDILKAQEPIKHHSGLLRENWRVFPINLKGTFGKVWYKICFSGFSHVKTCKVNPEKAIQSEVNL